MILSNLQVVIKEIEGNHIRITIDPSNNEIRLKFGQKNVRGSLLKKEIIEFVNVIANTYLDEVPKRLSKKRVFGNIVISEDSKKFFVALSGNNKCLVSFVRIHHKIKGVMEFKYVFNSPSIWFKKLKIKLKRNCLDYFSLWSFI